VKLKSVVNGGTVKKAGHVIQPTKLQDLAGK
jgi:hypothetical protein